VRLAHCSDLHLLSHDGAGLMKLANKRWIGAANLLSNRSRHYHVAAFDQMIEDLNAQGIDHVLCTGDVTNLALEQEFAFAREKFDHLAGGPGGVTVIPGNHDAYVAEGIELFGRFFDEYHRADPGWEWPDGSRWPIVRIRGPLALIGVTTSRATPWFTAYGRVGESQLARLQRSITRRPGARRRARSAGCATMPDLPR
jgi:3',5'-cyclic AMP phosphodiesterase CpdA